MDQFIQTDLECIEVGETSLHTVEVFTGQATCNECAGTHELTGAEVIALLVDA